jgi:Zn-dependent peptidase ImmA (M78 family)
MTMKRPNLSYLEGEQIRPINWSKDQVEGFASRVASAFGFVPGTHPSKLVERLRGRIHYQDIIEWLAEDGSIFVHGDNDFDVLLPRYTSPLRDRFTIAHELGHYFLHSNQGESPIIATRQGSSRIEWEANWFAAALLMPSDAFRKSYEDNGKNLAVVAARFGVSQEAARVRKDVLGI